MGSKTFNFFLFLALGAGIFLVASFFFSSKEIALKPATLTPSFKPDSPRTVLGQDGRQDGRDREEPASETITLFLVGDIMLDRGVAYMVQREGGGDWRFPFLKIAKDFEGADLVFGNLEGPISDKGQRVGSRYSFRAGKEAVEGLREAGFSVLSLANNHALDYGRIALEQTMEILTANEIDFTGAGFNKEEAYGPRVKEVKGTKIAFLAFTNLGSPSWAALEQGSGIAWIETFERAGQAVRAAKDEADLVIVSLHSGKEYSLTPTPFQISFAKEAIDEGADLVVGHHPHVVQPVEQYKQGWVAYSLGNFIFDQSFSKATMESLALEVSIQDKKIKEVLARAISLNAFFQAELTK